MCDTCQVVISTRSLQKWLKIILLLEPRIRKNELKELDFIFLTKVVGVKRKQIELSVVFCMNARLMKPLFSQPHWTCVLNRWICSVGQSYCANDGSLMR